MGPRKARFPVLVSLRRALIMRGLRLALMVAAFCRSQCFHLSTIKIERSQRASAIGMREPSQSKNAVLTAAGLAAAIIGAGSINVQLAEATTLPHALESTSALFALQTTDWTAAECVIVHQTRAP